MDGVGGSRHALAVQSEWERGMEVLARRHLVGEKQWEGGCTLEREPEVELKQLPAP